MKLWAILSILLLSACGADPLHCDPSTKQVGMWYSTWYKANDPNFWGDYHPTRGRYDSNDDGVIDEHIKTLEQAGVDFVILDNTNNLHVYGNYILDSSLHFCSRALQSRIGVVVAVGGMQYGGGAQRLAEELLEVKQLFVDGSCGASYLKSELGPVIVSYAPDNLSDSDQAALTAQHPDIDLRWIHGVARSGEMGWANPAGSLPSCDVMVSMPGWQNAYGQYVDRAGGSFYINSLNAALSVNPSMVVIASFNDFAGERTGIEPTLEYGDWYWNQTVDFIAKYKNP